MEYVTAYDIIRDSRLDLLPSLIGLAVLVAGLAWRIVTPHRSRLPLIVMAIGGVAFLAMLGLPWWDRHRMKISLANGDARMVEGPIRDWGTRRIPRAGGTAHYLHQEHFTVGGMRFSYYWEVEQPGFHNAVTPRVDITEGMPARIWYLQGDGIGNPPRIVRFDIGPVPR